MPRIPFIAPALALLFSYGVTLPQITQAQTSSVPMWMNLSSGSGASGFHTLAGLAGDEQLFFAGMERPGYGLSGFWGQGEGLSSLSPGHFSSSVDARLFHPTFSRDIRFSGAALDLYPFQGGQWTVGASQIEAGNAPDRTNWFTQWRSQRWDVQLFQIRHSEGIAAHAFALNLRLPIGGVLASHIAGRDQTGTRLLSWEVNLSHRLKLGFQVRDGRSTRYTEGGYQRWLVSLSGSSGLPPGVHRNQEATERPGMAGTALLAAAAVGVALVASSGSDSADSQLRYTKQHDAARNVINGINPTSVAENREYGGWVYQNADATFSATEPRKGTVDTVNLGSPLEVPGGAITTASYHTHGAYDPAYDNEHFSPTDIALDNAWALDGYLGTPAGYFKYHHYITGLVLTLGTVAN